MSQPKCDCPMVPGHFSDCCRFSGTPLDFFRFSKTQVNLVLKNSPKSAQNGQKRAKISSVKEKGLHLGFGKSRKLDPGSFYSKTLIFAQQASATQKYINLAVRPALSAKAMRGEPLKYKSNFRLGQ